MPDFKPPLNMVSIYSAGKTWMAADFRKLRDRHGFNINARWIDIQQALTGPDDIFPDEVHADEEYKREIWDNGCKVDCLNADMGILVARPEDKNMHSGSLVELGHITAFNKPMYILGTCESFEPAGNSDRAWKSQECVHFWPEETDAIKGFYKAVGHYQMHYAEQWFDKYKRIA